jgi:hypothetical protein
MNRDSLVGPQLLHRWLDAPRNFSGIRGTSYADGEDHTSAMDECGGARSCRRTPSAKGQLSDFSRPLCNVSRNGMRSRPVQVGLGASSVPARPPPEMTT